VFVAVEELAGGMRGDFDSPNQLNAKNRPPT